MVLEDVELGLGACYIWYAVFAMNNAEVIVKELHLPEGYVPCCAVGIGKIEEKYQPRAIPENRIRVQYNKLSGVT